MTTPSEGSFGVGAAGAGCTGSGGVGAGAVGAGAVGSGAVGSGAVGSGAGAWARAIADANTTAIHTAITARFTTVIEYSELLRAAQHEYNGSRGRNETAGGIARLGGLREQREHERRERRRPRRRRHARR